MKGDAVSFRRATRPGCDWIASSYSADELAQSIRSSVLERSDLSPEGHTHIAKLLLGKLVRHPPNRHAAMAVRRIEAHAQRAIHSHPTAWLPRRILGTAYMIADEVSKGTEVLQSCRPFSGELFAEIELDSIRLGIEAGATIDAGRRLDALAAEAKGSERFLDCKAAFLRSLHHFRSAEELLGLALETWPRSLNLRIELAATLWGSGKLDDALKHFLAMKAEWGELPYVQWNHVAALALCGHLHQAENELVSSSPSVASDVDLRQLVASRLEPRGFVQDTGLAGDFSIIALPDLLATLGQSRATGTLVADSPHGHGVIHLWRGQLVFARSTRRDAASATLQESDVESSPNRCLVELEDAHPPNELRPAAWRRLQSALREMVAWRSGRFWFVRLREALYPPVAGQVAFEVTAALLEAYVELDTQEAMRQ